MLEVNSPNQMQWMCLILNLEFWCYYLCSYVMIIIYESKISYSLTSINTSWCSEWALLWIMNFDVITCARMFWLLSMNSCKFSYSTSVKHFWVKLLLQVKFSLACLNFDDVWRCRREQVAQASQALREVLELDLPGMKLHAEDRAPPIAPDACNRCGRNKYIMPETDLWARDGVGPLKQVLCRRTSSVFPYKEFHPSFTSCSASWSGSKTEVIKASLAGRVHQWLKMLTGKLDTGTVLIFY